MELHTDDMPTNPDADQLLRSNSITQSERHSIRSNVAVLKPRVHLPRMQANNIK
jgi:hypothetical protein